MGSFHVLLTLLGLVTLSSSHVIVWNSHLFDNGQEFYIRGVDYSPGIIGQCTTNFVTGYGGTGFCSAKLTPFNEWKSACYDSDYFDGRPWPQNTSINGFQPLWERDLPLIQSYGANLIRLYNCNPSTLAATQMYTNLFPFPYGKDHTLFMQTAQKYNLRVAFPLNMANSDFPSLPIAKFLRYLRWQIDEVGGLPALLYWVMGNEQAWTWSTVDVATASIVAQYNGYVDYVKRYTYSKWGRWIPISLSTHNSPYDAAQLMPYLHLDFYSENFFSTTNGDYDWMMVNGISNNKKWFEGYKNLTCKYTKPFLISEFGKTYSVGQTYVQGSIPQILYNIYRYTQFGLLGGIFYEATDEPYAPNVNGAAYNYVFNNFGVTSLSITPASNGKCNSNATNCFVPDTATIKSAQYNDITAGTYNNVNEGYLQPITTVLGRSLYTTSNVPDYCAALNYKQCPNASPNTPMCSGNGMCNRILGQCVCGSGWGGSDCSVPSCPSSCNNQGTCSSLVSPPECVCNSGYWGNACQYTLANRAANSCPGVGNCTYGNGVCNNVTFLCKCWPGWTGLDCAVTDLTYAGSTSSSSAGVTTSTSSVGASTAASASSTTSASAASTASVVSSTVATTSSASSSSAATAASTTSAASASAATSSSSVSASTSSSASSLSSALAASSSSSSNSAATSLAASTAKATSTLTTTSSATSGTTTSSSTVGVTTSASSTSAVTASTSATSSTSTKPSSATTTSSASVATSTSSSGPSSTSASTPTSASSSTTGSRAVTSTVATSATSASSTSATSATSTSAASSSASSSSSTGATSTASQSVVTLSTSASSTTSAKATSATTASASGQTSSSSSTTGSVVSTTASATEGVSTTSASTSASTATVVASTSTVASTVASSSTASTSSTVSGTQSTTTSSVSQASSTVGSSIRAASTSSVSTVSTASTTATAATTASSGSTTSTRASSVSTTTASQATSSSTTAKLSGTSKQEIAPILLIASVAWYFL